MMHNQAGIGEKDLSLAIELLESCGYNAGMAIAAQKGVMPALTGDDTGT